MTFRDNAMIHSGKEGSRTGGGKLWREEEWKSAEARMHVNERTTGVTVKMQGAEVVNLRSTFQSKTVHKG